MIPLLVGAGIGLASLASNAYDSYKNREAAQNVYNGIMDKANAVSAQNQSDINSFMQRMYDTYGTGADQYGDAVSSFLNSPVYQNEGFGYQGDVEQFFDPAANHRVQAAMDAINNASATGGNRFSSDYLNQVAAKQQALASEEWEKAYNRLMQDRQQQMNEWQANSQNAWQNFNAQNDRAKYAVDIYGNDRDKLMQGVSDATMAGMNNRTGTLQAIANAMGGMANASQGPGVLSQGLNSIASFLGSYYG